MEDGGVGADAERETKNRNAEESPFEPDQAEGVAKILPEVCEKADGIHAVGVLLGEGDVAEFASRRKGGLLRTHAARDVFVDFVL
jgi:hypothetical protein